MAARMMVFNDSLEILELFYEMLSGEGYTVSTHSYGTLDLPLVKANRPDLIILDFPPSQREDQGWQMLQKIKMCRETQDIPLIICTTNMRAIHENEGWLAAKEIAVVPKPFFVDELLQAVDLQLQRGMRPRLDDRQH